jgi:hypothetical protein
MRHITLERRDRWFYGAVVLCYVVVMILLFSAHRQLGLTFSSVLIPATFAYAGVRGHLAAIFQHKDSDKKDDHVA